MNWKIDQENLIFEKLKEKVTHDKAARYLNKLLMNTKKMIQEQELLVVQVENSHGKNLLEIARLNTSIENEKIEYQELLQGNNEKEKDISKLQKEIKKIDALIEGKQMKIITLNKMIDQVCILDSFIVINIYRYFENLLRVYGGIHDVHV